MTAPSSRVGGAATGPVFSGPALLAQSEPQELYGNQRMVVKNNISRANNWTQGLAARRGQEPRVLRTDSRYACLACRQRDDLRQADQVHIFFPVPQLDFALKRNAGEVVGAFRV